MRISIGNATVAQRGKGCRFRSSYSHGPIEASRACCNIHRMVAFEGWACSAALRRRYQQGERHAACSSARASSQRGTRSSPWWPGARFVCRCKTRPTSLKSHQFRPTYAPSGHVCARTPRGAASMRRSSVRSALSFHLFARGVRWGDAISQRSCSCLPHRLPKEQVRA